MFVDVDSIYASGTGDALLERDFTELEDCFMFPSSISLSLDIEAKVDGGGGGRLGCDKSLGGVNISCSANRGRMGVVTLAAPPVGNDVPRYSGV